MCCLSCSVGEEIGKANGKCNRHIYPSYDEIVQEECCENFQTGFNDHDYVEGGSLNNTIDDNEESSGDDDIEKSICPNIGCEHDCEMRDGRPYCFCAAGFKLLPNKISCGRIPCKTGYKFNEMDQQCEGLKSS